MPNAVANAGFKTIYLRPFSPSMPTPLRACEKPKAQHLLVESLDLLDLLPAAHKDTGPVVDVLGYDFEHALHLAVDSLATGWSERARFG